MIQTLEESGFSHNRFYIHCDGALFGLMMPFVKRVSIYMDCSVILFWFSRYIVLDCSLNCQSKGFEVVGHVSIRADNGINL